MIRFVQPWWLLLLPFCFLPRRANPAVPFSAVALFDISVAPSWRMTLETFVRWLVSARLALLVSALARPTLAPTANEPGERLYLQFVIDISGSMGAPVRFEVPNSERRLERVKRLAIDFLDESTRHSSLPPVVGVISFAKRPEVVCPLTADLALVRQRITALAIDTHDNLTNIGDGLAVAIDGLDAVRGHSKILVLATDGAHNVATALAPGEAAQAAKTLGVKVIALHAATPTPGENPEDFARDAAGLQQIAAITGGRFLSHDSSQTLHDSVSDLCPLPTRPTASNSAEFWSSLVLLALLLWLLEAILRSTFVRVSPSGD